MNLVNDCDEWVPSDVAHLSYALLYEYNYEA